MIESGLATVYQHGKSVFIIVRVTKFVADVHLFSNEKGFGLIRNTKDFIQEFFATTDFVKLHAAFTRKQECSAAKRCGFKQEGVRENSHMLPSGELVNEYLYGVSKWVQY